MDNISVFQTEDAESYSVRGLADGIAISGFGASETLTKVGVCVETFLLCTMEGVCGFDSHHRLSGDSSMVECNRYYPVK